MARAAASAVAGCWWRVASDRAPDANDRTSHQRRATRDTTMTISTDLDSYLAANEARAMDELFQLLRIRA